MDAELERRTLAAEDSHWWYRGRRAIVLDAVRRVAAGSGKGAAPRILDAGCGGGGMLEELGSIGEPVGLEPSAEGRERALARGRAEIVEGTLEGLPFADASFELAICLDVLEHLADDVLGLRELHRVVQPGGGLVITVPAHPRLWSRHDELNHHHRRYARASLAAAASAGGWTVDRLTHFNTLLLPPAVLARRLGIGDDGLAIPPRPINRLLEGALQAERLAIRAGLRLPAGLSLLAQCRRRPVRAVG